MKTYYIPYDEYIDSIIGSESMVCMDRAALEELTTILEMPNDEGDVYHPTMEQVMDMFREATEAEIEEYGVYEG